MLLLPIGHEEVSVRRLPLVTFGILAICIVAFLLSGQGSPVSRIDVELETKAGEVFDYYLEHPSLEVDDEFEMAVYGSVGAVEREFSQFAVEFEGLERDPGATAWIVEQQAELDRLTDALLAARGHHALFRWGLIPAEFSLVGLVMHMFLHAGWLHLIGNLLILYLLGPFIEDVWGRPLYAAFYFLSGCAAAAVFIAFNAESQVPMVGASGAIAGVMGAFLLHYHRTKIKFFYLIGVFWRGTFDAAAWIMLPMWFGEQLLLAFLVGAEGSGVAYWAHVGGFGFGLAAALAVRRARILERFVQPQLDQAVAQSIVERPGLDLALAQRAQGRHEEAFDLLTTELRRTPQDADVAELTWETAALLDRRTETVPLMLRSLQAQLRNGEQETVRAMWQRLVETDASIRADPAFLLRLAQVQVRLADRDAARQTLRRALLGAGPAPAPGLALKIARLAIELDPAIARAALRALIRREDIGADDRRSAERLLAELGAPAVAAQTVALERAEPIPLALD